MIKIAYLAYDLMNLYGDSGNIKILKHHLKNNVEVSYISKGEIIDFSKYDMIYIGAGTEQAMVSVLQWLRPYKKELMNFDKLMIFCGNSFEMLGKTISIDGKIADGLEIFDFSVEIDTRKRQTKDIFEKSEFFEDEIIGFVNKSSKISNILNPMFANYDYGIFNENFIGANICGPILVKNPCVLKYVLEKLCTDEYDLSLEYKAYKVAKSKINA